jgi:DNA-binding NarL/FixJ family response regulator
MVKVDILIAESSEIIRHGLHTIFAKDPRVLNIQDVATEEDLSASITSFQPDLIIINQSMIRDISLLETRSFFVLAAEPRLATLKKMYRYGALGYLTLNVSAEILLTILGVTDRSFFIEPELGPWIMNAAFRMFDQSASHMRITPRKKRRVSTEIRVDVHHSLVGYLCIWGISAWY